jgi:hypothetical protein
MNVGQLVECELAWQTEVSEKIYLNATFPTTNPTLRDLGSNPGHRDGKPATNRLRHATTTFKK